MYRNTNCKLQAHRGVCTEAPENTMAAFRLAVEQGYDIIEFDPKMTKDKDGKPVPVMGKNKKGQQAVQITTAQDNATYTSVIVPLMEKQLGQKATGNYAFRHGEDLYIIYDGMISYRVSFKFLQETLKKYREKKKK